MNKVPHFTFDVTISKDNAKCGNCGEPFEMGKTGIDTQDGEICDVCACVVRNPLDGSIIEVHPAFAIQDEEDSLTDMEKA